MMALRPSYTFELISSASQIAQSLARQQPDLIIADSQLEDAHISEFVEQLGTIPFILATGMSEMQFAEQADKIGAVACLGKPLQPEALFKTIEHILGSRQTSTTSVKSNSGEDKINLDYLNHVSEGDNFFVAEMLKAYIKAIPELTNKMKVAFDKAEYEEMARYAHRFRSTLKAIGLDDKAAICDHIQDVYKQSEVKTELLKSDIGQLVSAATPLVSALQTTLHGLDLDQRSE